MVSYGVLLDGGDDSETDAKDNGNYERDRAEPKRDGEETIDDFVGFDVALVAGPEVEMEKDASEVVNVLLPERVVVVIFRFQKAEHIGTKRLLRGIPRVSRGQLDQDEHERIE